MKLVLAEKPSVAMSLSKVIGADQRGDGYERLSRDDDNAGESNSIVHQELLCKGWFLPPNTYDCGSFVVNETAVVGKEQNNPYNH